MLIKPAQQSPVLRGLLLTEMGLLTSVETCRTSGLSVYGIAVFIAGLSTEINTLRTGDADLRFYVTTVKDG